MKAKVINCHELGIRRIPWDPNSDKEIFTTIKAGEEVDVIELDPTYFSWDGREFYKVQTSSGVIGYALKNCLEVLNDG